MRSGDAVRFSAPGAVNCNVARVRVRFAEVKQRLAAVSGVVAAAVVSRLPCGTRTARRRSSSQRSSSKKALLVWGVNRQTEQRVLLGESYPSD
jgi:hypothetical protein